MFYVSLKHFGYAVFFTIVLPYSFSAILWSVNKDSQKISSDEEQNLLNQACIKEKEVGFHRHVWIQSSQMAVVSGAVIGQFFEFQLFKLKHSLIDWWQPVMSLKFLTRIVISVVYIPVFEALNKDQDNVFVTSLIRFFITFVLFGLLRPLFMQFRLTNKSTNLKDEMSELMFEVNGSTGTENQSTNPTTI